MRVSDLVTRLAEILQDATGIHWSPSNLLSCYNEGLLWTVQNRPDSNSILRDIAATGRARQNKPDDVYRMLGIIENTASGRVIEPIDRETLNAHNPNWQTETFGGYVEFYLTDERTPDVFWLYPTPPADYLVTGQASREPTLVTDPDNTDIEIPLIHLNALKHASLCFAYMQDGETEGNLMQAQAYLKMAANDLGLTWNIDLMFSKPIREGGKRG